MNRHLKLWDLRDIFASSAVSSYPMELKQECLLTAKFTEKAQRVMKAIKINQRLKLCDLSDNFAYSAVSSYPMELKQECLLTAKFTEKEQSAQRVLKAVKMNRRLILCDLRDIFASSAVSSYHMELKQDCLLTAKFTESIIFCSQKKRALN